MMMTAMTTKMTTTINRKDASLTGVNQGRERKVAAAGGQSSISSGRYCSVFILIFFITSTPYIYFFFSRRSFNF